MNNETTYYNKQASQTDLGPEVQISCCSNVYIRRMSFKKKGIIELGHTHIYDHVSFVGSGSVNVQVYDEETREMAPPKEFKAPAMIFIAKGKVHQITSLEDNTEVCCIHALRGDDEEIIDPSMFPVPTPLPITIEEYRKTTGKMLMPPAPAFDIFTGNRYHRPWDKEKVF
jgi:quercetin dioxygenase-like cupin family protein